MEKAILIMDMPSCCGDCPCSYEYGYDMCGAMEREIDFDSKPEWCPLLTVEQAKKEVTKC